jgi:hypothetical protein
MIRNRIKTHRKVRAGDLVPHEWIFRQYPEEQKAGQQIIICCLALEIGPAPR